MADEPARKPRGRPRLDPADESVNLSVRIPSKQFDELYGEASRQRISLPNLIRAAITAKLRRE